GFATISWLIGTQSTSTDVELLRIRSSYIYFNETDDSWWIRVRVFNEGSKTAEVKRIEIQGVETIELHPAQVIKPGEENEVNKTKRGIPAWINIQCKNTISIGNNIQRSRESGLTHPIPALKAAAFGIVKH
ncbi:MAG: hypothetical protein QXV54_02925, partial [Desulfurococcaceae archaeon]